MQLPHPMQVPRPGTALAGVALSFTAKPQQSLHAGRLLQRVERKLRRCHDGGEELMKLKHAHTLKPLRFTVNTAQKNRPRRTGIRMIDRPKRSAEMVSQQRPHRLQLPGSPG